MPELRWTGIAKARVEATHEGGKPTTGARAEQVLALKEERPRSPGDWG
jgi:hypothetical protein